MANEQIIKEAVAALNAAGSRTSRTHLQKLLFFAQSWGLLKPPRLEFVIYLHGPYSFELDKKLFEMECVRSVSRRPAPDGYGSLYSVDAPPHNDRLVNLAKWLGPLGARELESRATCQYFLDRGAKEPEAAVLKVKPHLTLEEVQAACTEVIHMRQVNVPS